MTTMEPFDPFHADEDQIRAFSEWLQANLTSPNGFNFVLSMFSDVDENGGRHVGQITNVDPKDLPAVLNGFTRMAVEKTFISLDEPDTVN